MRKLVILAAIILALLHHDFWWWKSTALIFGFLPIGLAWHALYSILASCLALFAIKYAWPLDEKESSNEGASS